MQKTSMCYFSFMMSRLWLRLLVWSLKIKKFKLKIFVINIGSLSIIEKKSKYSGANLLVTFFDTY